MDSPILPDRYKELTVLLAQYEQAWSDRRNYDQMIWQTPTISLAIVAILVSGLVTLFSKNGNWTVATTLGFMAFAVVVVGIVQLRKHRLFQMITVSELGRLETEIRHIAPTTRSMTFITPDLATLRERYHDVPVCPLLDQRRAYNWLFGLMCLVGFGVLVFSIFAFLCVLKV